MTPSSVVADLRAVDPIAYIRAVGLAPEDSYGFLPLDLHDASSYLFLYGDRPEYEQARAGLPEAESIKSVDLGVVGFDVGTPRQIGIDMPAEAPGGSAGEAIAQAQAMQQAWGGGAPAAPGVGDPQQLESLKKLKDMGVYSEEEYRELVAAVGGDAGPAPGAAPAVEAPPGAPALVAQRLYPRLYKRSTSDQLDHFMPRYRDALGLCPEDVYGVFPRHTREISHGDSSNNTLVWEDYWIVYRDRPEYAAGRESWKDQMNEKGGFAERMFSSMMKGQWPDAQVVPGVAAAGQATFDGAKVKVEEDRWPREKLVMRTKGPELGQALREKVTKWGYGPQDSFGFCPDFNSNNVYFAWRKR